MVAEGIDIEACTVDRIAIGDWGKNDAQSKLNRCANEVKADSRCGTSFFFRETKGRCFCERAGVNCIREPDVLKNEYRLKTGAYQG